MAVGPGDGWRGHRFMSAGVLTSCPRRPWEASSGLCDGGEASGGASTTANNGPDSERGRSGYHIWRVEVGGCEVRFKVGVQGRQTDRVHVQSN